MEKIPLELHHKIYRSACLDDGSTGCSLSAVSHYIRNASADYRYESIALNNSRQIARFYDFQVVNEQSGRHVRVRHLYVCVRPTNHILSQDALQESRRSMDTDEWKLVPLLRSLDSSLETLSVVVPDIYSRFSSKILYDRDGTPVSFPNLVELSLCGRIFMPITPAFAPKLERLHLTHLESVQWLPNCFLRHQFPMLSHFRCSTAESAFQQALLAPMVTSNIVMIACLMGIISKNAVSQAASRFGFSIPEPSTQYPGQSIIISADKVIIDALTAMLNDQHDLFHQAPGRLVLERYCPYLLPQDTDSTIKAEWLERLEGQAGCWIEVGS